MNDFIDQRENQPDKFIFDKIPPNILEDNKIPIFLDKNKELLLKILPELKENNFKNIIGFKPNILNEIAPFPRVELVRGDIDGLLEFMEAVAQRDEAGNLRYLLTSGVAIELITGFRRHHHDLDIVRLAPLTGAILKAVDQVSPEGYWVDMVFTKEYMEATAYEVQFADRENHTHTVSTVHPAILLVQKLSDYGKAKRRPKDIEDAGHLYSFWVNSLNSDPSWNPIMQAALQALPKMERSTVSDRLAALLMVKLTPKE